MSLPRYPSLTISRVRRAASVHPALNRSCRYGLNSSSRLARDAEVGEQLVEVGGVGEPPHRSAVASYRPIADRDIPYEGSC